MIKHNILTRMWKTHLIISIRREISANNTSLTMPFLIEVCVPNQEVNSSHV
jgi:hypothetical protein